MTERLSRTRLALFFTRRGSLCKWDDAGILEREVALYRRLLPALAGVTFVTHGDRRDAWHRSRIEPVGLVYNRFKLSPRGYERSVSAAFPLLVRGRSIVKSNQVEGADLALRTARRWGRPFVARCGYLRSGLLEWRHGYYSEEAKRARTLEREVFTGADRVVVTSEDMRATIVERDGVTEERVRVIPNYVETDVFRPDSTVAPVSGRISHIGRFDVQKNALGLLEAVRGLDVEVVMVGKGGLLEDEVRDAAERWGIRLELLGQQPHGKLPEILRSSEVFVLPSRWEGHPKALLEAMACGVPVIGMDSPGIRDAIVHGENGYLCGPEPADIRGAIENLLGDEALRRRLGAGGREHVVERFSLDRVVERELALYEELV